MEHDQLRRRQMLHLRFEFRNAHPWNHRDSLRPSQPRRKRRSQHEDANFTRRKAVECDLFAGASAKVDVPTGGFRVSPQRTPAFARGYGVAGGGHGGLDRIYRMKQNPDSEKLKLARSPRSLTAALAALPSISEIPFLDFVHSVQKNYVISVVSCLRAARRSVPAFLSVQTLWVWLKKRP